MSNALDNFYLGMLNVVLRDNDGKPSVFVRFPKQNSSEFDSTYLPATPHPAFMCGENVVDNAILIGKYPSCRLTAGGPLYSLPNIRPANDVSHDDIYGTSIFPSGMGVTSMTIADWGLILMMHHKAGDGLPYGPVKYGSDPRDGIVWERGYNINVGTVRVYGGWAYECLTYHKCANDILPPNSPQYWKRLNKVGATVCDYYDYYGSQVLTGSGPSSYYMFGDVSSIYFPSAFIKLRDIRIKNGELQIIPYNKAADPSYTVTDNSADWKAIQPTGSDHGYNFVTPGSATNTIKYAYSSASSFTVVARDLASGEFNNDYSQIMFQNIAVDSTTIPSVPYILYELGIVPIPGTALRGFCQCRYSSSNAIRYLAVGKNVRNGAGNSETEKLNGINAQTTYNGSGDTSSGNARLRAREIS